MPLQPKKYRRRVYNMLREHGASSDDAFRAAKSRFADSVEEYHRDVRRRLQELEDIAEFGHSASGKEE